ncbi:hypothetical protein [Terriglobus albidus]|uniref:hypothetical protein n=1 Tax=Terriglobus albidus TaxID=1592106 RepID=UPI0021E005AE|nr:hypothetical protein [Terriglobus albidus]
MKPILLHLLTLCLVLSAQPSFAQTASPPQGQSKGEDASAPPKSPDQALVTFFSSGHFLKSALPGYKHGEFLGRIMDKDGQLAMLTFDHFVTFRVDAGPHTFSANSWLLPTPQTGGHLKLDLVAGKHYFVGAYTQSFLYYTRFRLEAHTCQEAKEINEKTEPLDPKHLKDHGKAMYIPETAFPDCL